MPTNAIILSNAPIASVLAGNDISKGSLYGQRIDPLLDQKIYATYFVIKKIYDLNPNYTGITAACLYLWELMGKYGIQAQSYTNGGGVISGITGGGLLTFESLAFTVGVAEMNDGDTVLIITANNYLSNSLSINLDGGADLQPNLSDQFSYTLTYTTTNITITFNQGVTNGQKYYITYAKR